MHLKQGFALMQSLTKLKWSWSATHSMLSPSLCERANNLKTLKRAKGRGRTLHTNEWDRKETLIMFIIWCYDDLLRCRWDRAMSSVQNFQRKNQTDERERERERERDFKFSNEKHVLSLVRLRVHKRDRTSDPPTNLTLITI
jgi:hypothetical protein